MYDVATFTRNPFAHHVTSEGLVEFGKQANAKGADTLVFYDDKEDVTWLRIYDGQYRLFVAEGKFNLQGIDCIKPVVWED